MTVGNCKTWSLIANLLITSTIADARHQEENPMRKKCLKAIVQEGHNICTSEWQMLSAILKANTVKPYILAAI